MSQDTKSTTRALLLAHREAYPALQIRDVFKYLFQSAFGCEHLVADEAAALRYIRREYEACPKNESPAFDRLDGAYSRVHLSWLNGGLHPETLAKLFCTSAKIEPDGREALLEKLEVARGLVQNGELPLDLAEFDRLLAEWSAMGYPAIHHSDTFRAAYRPAYRVISEAYVPFLPLLTEIDRLLERGNTIVALEGGSAGGKSTLASLLERLYDCTVFHMDDFFLRPEQRTAQRLSEVGGNLDRERFSEEILRALAGGEPVRYRPFDCATQTLGEPVTAERKRLTVVEGVYALHPAFGRYFDLAVFLDIDPALQRERIRKRNTPALARRFFEEWIPMENAYFAETDTRGRCDLTVQVGADTREREDTLSS